MACLCSRSRHGRSSVGGIAVQAPAASGRLLEVAAGKRSIRCWCCQARRCLRDVLSEHMSQLAWRRRLLGVHGRCGAPQSWQRCEVSSLSRTVTISVVNHFVAVAEKVRLGKAQRVGPSLARSLVCLVDDWAFRRRRPALCLQSTNTIHSRWAALSKVVVGFDPSAARSLARPPARSRTSNLAQPRRRRPRSA